jgi:hypothetical protein
MVFAGEFGPPTVPVPSAHSFLPCVYGLRFLSSSSVFHFSSGLAVMNVGVKQ